MKRVYLLRPNIAQAYILASIASGRGAMVSRWADGWIEILTWPRSV